MSNESRPRSKVRLGDDTSSIRPANAEPLESARLATNQRHALGETPATPHDDSPAAKLPAAEPSAAQFPGQSGTLERVHADSEDTGSVVIRRNHRVAAKVQEARRLLDTLPQGDRKARLLHAATVRRDEVVLDALLAELAADAK